MSGGAAAPDRPTVLVHAEGDGPAVLWIHGYTMNHEVWRPLWDRLPGYRHVGIDLPGHGGSADMVPGTTLRGLAEQVAAVAADEDASRVVAISMGTMIAFEIAIAGLADIERLVVAAPTMAGMPEEPGTAERYRQLWVVKRGGAPAEIIADLWMSSPPDIFTGLAAHPDQLASVRATVAGHRWAELLSGAMAGVSSAVQSLDDLPGSATRILVMSGTEDMPTFRDLATRLAAAPGVEVLTLPGLGHLPLLEQPAETAPALAAFLAP